MLKSEQPLFTVSDTSPAWPDPYLYICFNDNCPFFVKGWESMMEHYGRSASYRFMYQPTNGKDHALCVFTKDALRGQIIEEE
ncbi:MAG TPA: hypothetical protein ENG86_02255 [Nitrospirae bacterium]|nr:hypothetical protein [Nitrospirota bacterium]HDO21663.1 hypothetical protein [Nitrospirota bacterium]